MTGKNTGTLPRWDLSNVYPSLDSPEFTAAFAELEQRTEKLQGFLQQTGVDGPEGVRKGDFTFLEITDGYLERANAILKLYSTLRAYIWSFVSTDSFNTAARKLLSQLEQSWVPLQNADTSFTAWLGRHADQLPEALEMPGPSQEHTFYLQEQVEQSRYQMSNAEEGLAAELSLSGSHAWSRLQGTVCSQLTVEFDQGNGVETIPITALQNLGHHPDAALRRRAYETELFAWKSVEEPLAAALNGVKGSAITLYKRRGRTDALHETLDQARIDRPTLEAMLQAMQDSFPQFRRYLRAKAKRLGHTNGLPWYDLAASTSASTRSYTWDETVDFITTQFGRFSPHLAELAGQAFERHWIDAEPRPGKRGGAFCMSVDAVEESRILCNFDGSLDQVFTVAHELGHSFHNSCFKGKTRLQTITPMTLAETASIFCETIVTDAVSSQAATPDEELAILEPALDGLTQIIVDISSRFQFEKEVFERREKAELSVAEFCDIMLRAQEATYGDGLDPDFRNPYMWTWKPHYYRSELNFYNFPYAFGQLFGTGLYAIYQERGQSFVSDYENLLGSTGMGRAADLAARFDIDLRSPEFWRSSLAVIGERIDRYISLGLS